MAVKKHGLDSDNNLPHNLGTMLSLLHDVPKGYMSNSKLFQYCKSIITLLSKIPIPKNAKEQEIFYSQVHQAECFLKKTVIETGANSKINWLYSLLEHLYLIISTASPCTSPAVCIVLSLLDNSMRNVAVSIFIRQGASNGGEEENSNSSELDNRLCNALATLSHWLCYWTGTPSLHEWIISFMTELQEANKTEILLEVAARVICDLFDALQNPLVRTVVINVVLHILASTRDSLETFHKISCQVPSVLENLASDTSPESRSVLQSLVEVFTALFDSHPEEKEKYTEIIACLDSHIKSNKGYIMEVPLWKKRTGSVTEKKKNCKVGLVNLGNTCYMNSALQALFMTKLFSNGIIMSNLKFPLMYKLKALFAHLMFSELQSIFPYEIYIFSKPCTFRRGAEQDTSEFICHLLDRLHNYEIHELYYKSAQTLVKPITNEADLNVANCSSSSTSTSTKSTGGGKRKRNGDAAEGKRRCTRLEEIGSSRDPMDPPTLVQKVFAGMTNTSIRCTECNYTSSKNDPFWDLQLAFPETEESNDYSVQQLIDYYFSPEKLFGDNRYHCQDCKTLQDAERSVTIDSSPKNLIIVLKQFYYNPKSFLRSKLFHRVELNSCINLVEKGVAKFYELYGVIVHSGSTLDNGHYYTVAKEPSNDWFVFDDSSVQPCTEETAYGMTPKCTPYILFYKKLNDDVPVKISCNPNEKNELSDVLPGTANTPEKVFDPAEENLPFSFLPAYLAKKVKRKMNPTRRRRGLSMYGPGNFSSSAALGRCSSSDEDQPGSSQMN